MAISETGVFEWSESAVLKHIDILQSIINRMSSNSTNCKAWCISLVSAIIVFAVKEHNVPMGAMVLIPLLLLYFLDSFYLSLERDFRNRHELFVKSLHDKTFRSNQLFNFKLEKGFQRRLKLSAKAAIDSASTLLFYLLLFILSISAVTYILLDC